MQNVRPWTWLLWPSVSTQQQPLNYTDNKINNSLMIICAHSPSPQDSFSVAWNPSLPTRLQLWEPCVSHIHTELKWTQGLTQNNSLCSSCLVWKITKLSRHCFVKSSAPRQLQCQWNVLDQWAHYPETLSRNVLWWKLLFLKYSCV